MGSSQKTGRPALYRTYRSRTLDDVKGQDHITKTLSNALKSDLISQAYLFTGPRGVGKTSVARILAHAANKLDYDGNSNHLDVIEIDAASNRGIDEVRDLRDKVHLVPSMAKYKVYIIDEVHMLTTPAFNALLKTLEEPPAHVIFIMATTEAHKVPETIISRSQWFTFMPIAEEVVVEQLLNIANKESLKLDEDAAKALAGYARGSLRDAISMLDQLSSSGQTITKNEVFRLVGLASDEAITDLLEALSNGDSNNIVSLLDQLRSRGSSPTLIAKQLIDEIELGDLDNASLDLIENLVGVIGSTEPELMLKIVLLKHALASANSSQNVPSGNEIKTLATTRSDLASELNVDELWPSILRLIKDNNNSLYAVLRLAEVKISGNEIELTFGFHFHKNRVSEEKNQQAIKQAIIKVTGQTMKISVKHDSNRAKPPTNKPNDLTGIIQVMGGGSIVEYEDE